MSGAEDDVSSPKSYRPFVSSKDTQGARRRFTIRGLDEMVGSDDDDAHSYASSSTESYRSESTMQSIEIAVKPPYRIVAPRDGHATQGVHKFDKSRTKRAHVALGDIVDKFLLEHREQAVGFFRSEFRRLPVAGLYRKALGIRVRDRIVLLMLVALVTVLYLFGWTYETDATMLSQELASGLAAERLLKSDPPPQLLTMTEHKVPYGASPFSRHCRCHNVVPTTGTDLHLTGFERRIKSSVHSNFVRSITLFDAGEDRNAYCREGPARTGSPSSLDRHKNHKCSDFPGGPQLKMLWQWSQTAATEFHLPASTGFLLRKGRARWFVLQVEYDVSTLSQKLWRAVKPMDSSGVRLTLTKTLRPHNAAVLQLGSVDFTLHPSIECGRVTTEHELDRSGILQMPVTVFGGTTKTRGLGLATRLNIMRQGTTSVQEWRSDITDHVVGYNEQPRMVEPVLDELTVHANDTLTMACKFNTSGLAQPVVAGMAPRQEMCLGFLYIFPLEHLMTQRITFTRTFTRDEMST